MDTCSTWITHGPAESLGYEARDAGFDVYLGNYRGVYPRKTKEPVEDYWDYSIDHLAKYDIHAFMKKIFEIKLKDFK